MTTIKAHSASNSQQTFKEILNPKIRISLLARPNSIKDKYVQGCLRSASNHSKLSVLKENIPLVKKSAVPIYSAKNIDKKLGQNVVRHNQKYTTESQCEISSSKCKTVKYASLNIANKNSANCCKIPGAKLLEKNTCSLDERHLKCLGHKTIEENECMKRLCDNLESTEIIVPENGLNAKHLLSKMLYTDRNELMHLKCELENLISTEEENLSKWKSILTYVMELLSILQITISQTDISKETETNAKIMLDKEIQTETCKLEQPTEENSKFQDLESLNRNDKENVAGGCTDSFPDNTDKRFQSLENQLNIQHTEPLRNTLPCNIRSSIKSIIRNIR